MIGGWTVFRLGLGQLISWGVTYYLVGVLGARIAADLGWSLTAVNGGFALALLVMGIVSPLAGRLIETHGGRWTMAGGALIGGLGCAGLAVAHAALPYYAAWAVIGLAMRLTLYDAAFAALARIAGPKARPAMARITLLGGLASAVFWPLGDALADAFGWRGAALAFGAFSAAAALLYASLPTGRFVTPQADAASEELAEAAPPGLDPASRRRAAILYALATAFVSMLNSAMSAHMIGILAGLGMTLQAAVWTASLRGFGQTGARGCEVLFGGRMRPVDLNLFAAGVLALCFPLALWSGSSLPAAIAFVLLFGAGNGLSSITRGTLPFAFFDPAAYGSLVGRLIAPSFILAAAAPLGYAYAIEAFGAAAAVWLSAALGAGAFGAAIGLKTIERRARARR